MVIIHIACNLEMVGIVGNGNIKPLVEAAVACSLLIPSNRGEQFIQQRTEEWVRELLR